MLGLQGVADVIDGVSEDLNTGTFSGFRAFSLPEKGLFSASPVRMVCPVVECLGMGHQSEYTAGRVANAGHIFQGTVGVRRPLAPGRTSGLIGILQYDLVAFEKAIHVFSLGIKLSFSVSHGQFDRGDASGKDTGRIRVDLEAHPGINKISCIVICNGHAALLVVPIKTGKKPPVDQGLKAITYSDDQFPLLQELCDLFTQIKFHL